MKQLLVIISVTVAFSCSEEFPLDTFENSERIVVEGAITNEPGPYYFRISKSSPLGSLSYSGPGIKDAFITISDNSGIIDTLKHLDAPIEQHPIWYYYYIAVENYDGVYDTIRLIGNDPSTLIGIYHTTKISGQIGNTYNFNLAYEDQDISGQEKMHSVPEIDTVIFKNQYLSKDGAEFLVPYIYFSEPKSEKNYYMFNFGNDDLVDMITGIARVWHFSILNDEYLPDYVNGFNLDDGASPVGHEDFFYFSQGEYVTIRMLSLTEGAYNFYKSLLEQFENDGGAYSPTPTTPTTNLTNGGLGYFRVSAVSEKRMLVH
jgi:hypothetical protein